MHNDEIHGRSLCYKTIIIGAGVVELNIASRLVDEGHDVTVVDTNQAALDRISNTIDVNTVGDTVHPRSSSALIKPLNDRIGHRFG